MGNCVVAMLVIFLIAFSLPGYFLWQRYSFNWQLCHTQRETYQKRANIKFDSESMPVAQAWTELTSLMDAVSQEAMKTEDVCVQINFQDWFSEKFLSVFRNDALGQVFWYVWYRLRKL